MESIKREKKPKTNGALCLCEFQPLEKSRAEKGGREVQRKTEGEGARKRREGQGRPICADDLLLRS